MIEEYLALLPKKNRTNHQYLMWYRVENDDNLAWEREPYRQLRDDDIEYPKENPFISLTGLIP